jgi:hypothetical protein
LAVNWTARDGPTVLTVPDTVSSVFEVLKFFQTGQGHHSNIWLIWDCLVEDTTLEQSSGALIKTELKKEPKIKTEKTTRTYSRKKVKLEDESDKDEQVNTVH